MKHLEANTRQPERDRGRSGNNGSQSPHFSDLSGLLSETLERHESVRLADFAAPGLGAMILDGPRNE